MDPSTTGAARRVAPRVAVIGLGAIGAMTTWRLATRGAEVTGFEQFGPAHDRGASAGQTRRLSVQTQRERRLTPVALHAVELWRELERASGVPLLTQTGGIILGPAGTPALESARLSAEEHGLEHEVLTGPELRRRYPEHVVREGDVGVTDPHAGFLRPEAAVARALEVAARAGATVRTHTRVLAVEPTGSGVGVTTAEGTETFDRVVLTAGPWARELLPRVATTVLPRRLAQAWFIARDPALFDPSRTGVFERVGDVAAYGFPTVDGVTVKVGVWTAPHPVVHDLHDVRRSVSTALAQRIAAVVEEFFPALMPDPVSLVTGMEGYTTDGLGLLGRLPDHDRVVVGCGFSGSGFKFAPAFGEALAATALEEPTRDDLGFLAPDRELAPWSADLLAFQ